MARSTAGLARELGMNSQEMNILLRDEGYLEGEPGDWKLTEKGQESASQQHWDVPSSMHAGYVTTRWNEDILEDIGTVSPERKQEIRDEIAARRAEQRKQREECRAERESEAEDDLDNHSYATADDDDMDIDGKTVGVVIAVIAGSILLAKGIKKAKPHVERWWGETAQPRIAAAKEQVIAKFKKTEDGKLELETSESEGAEELESLIIEEQEAE